MLANPLKGEVSFPVAGEEMTLVYSVNSLIGLEERLGMAVPEIGAKMSANPTLKFLRTVFWGGLQEHHPDVSEVDAGNLMSAVGLAECAALISGAFFKAFASDAEADKTKPRPPKATAKKKPAGTGPGSSASGAS